MAPMPAPLFDEDLPTLFQLAAILPPVTPSGNRLLDWTGRKRMSTAYFDPLVVVQALVDGRWTVDGGEWAACDDDREIVESVLATVLRELSRVETAAPALALCVSYVRARVAPVHAAVVAKISALQAPRVVR